MPKEFSNKSLCSLHFLSSSFFSFFGEWKLMFFLFFFFYLFNFSLSLLLQSKRWREVPFRLHSSPHTWGHWRQTIICAFRGNSRWESENRKPSLAYSALCSQFVYLKKKKNFVCFFDAHFQVLKPVWDPIFGFSVGVGNRWLFKLIATVMWPLASVRTKPTSQVLAPPGSETVFFFFFAVTCTWVSGFVSTDVPLVTIDGIYHLNFFFSSSTNDRPLCQMRLLSIPLTPQRIAMPTCFLVSV